jgi:hypothetical protein
MLGILDRTRTRYTVYTMLFISQLVSFCCIQSRMCFLSTEKRNLLVMMGTAYCETYESFGSLKLEAYTVELMYPSVLNIAKY